VPFRVVMLFINIPLDVDSLTGSIVVVVDISMVELVLEGFKSSRKVFDASLVGITLSSLVFYNCEIRGERRFVLVWLSSIALSISWLVLFEHRTEVGMQLFCVEEEIFLDWIIVLEDDSLGDRRLTFVLSFIVILDCPSWVACVVVGVVNTDRFVIVMIACR